MLFILLKHKTNKKLLLVSKGVELGGRRVRVGWAQKNTSLCVGGLDPSVTTDMLVREFGRFGPLDKDLTTIKPGGENRTAPPPPTIIAAPRATGERAHPLPFCNIWRKPSERPKVVGFSITIVETVLRLERDAWSIVKRLRQATKEYAPSPPRLGEGIISA